MDKETLSHYGWIVILVLILAVLLALATPFGSFIAGAIKSTTAGFFSVNQSALNSTGLINIGNQTFDDGNSDNVGSDDSIKQEPVNCEHTYESDVVVNCDTVGTITYTCSKCGDQYTEERTTATHTFDNAKDLTCNECNVRFLEYAFDTADYDSKMGTTTATDLHVDIPITFEHNGKKYKVTEIEEYGFENCPLATVSIPDSVYCIDRYAFKGSKIEKIYIPDSVTITGMAVFSNCSKLTDVRLSENLKTLQVSTFYGCSSLKTITLPNSITWLRDEVFRSCSKLESIVLGDNITTLGENLFWNTPKLSEITIGKGITKIGYAVFDNSGIKKITIHAGVTEIGQNALDAYNLSEIIFEGTMEQWNSITFGKDWNKAAKATYVQCSDGQVPLS